jgi:hypothetical protein
MNQFPNLSPKEYDRMSNIVEQVYGSAYCAFELGVPKEVLIEQIELAFDCFHERKGER